MVFWRTWHLRNELTHGKSTPPLEVSCSLLLTYYNTFNQISLGIDEIIKGKSPMHVEIHAEAPKRQVTVLREP